MLTQNYELDDIISYVTEDLYSQEVQKYSGDKGQDICNLPLNDLGKNCVCVCALKSNYM